MTTLLGLVLAGSLLTGAQDARPDPRLDWWREARFGMFIHWGLYAIPAGEWNGRTGHGEWIRDTAQIPLETYEKFQGQFNPQKFDPNQWASLAKEAGMKYIVLTSKHHDGFALFDSKFSDWDVAGSPYKKDILAQLAPAVRAQGLKMCFYHSIMDWHHPDYLPRRPWENRSSEGADFDRYEKFLHSQVTELLTRYGDIGVMWFDGEWERTWNHARGQKLYDLCRRLQPNVIINNRVDVGRGGMAGMSTGEGYAGDYGTPEQEVPPTGIPGVDWETCMTMNGHWGYNKADKNYKSTDDLIKILVDICSKGGNLLLNVGPKADGTFPEESIDRLRGIGKWMKVNSEAIYGTTASPFEKLPWGRCTAKLSPRGSKLFLHVMDWPEDRNLVVPGLGSDPKRSRILGGKTVEFSRKSGDLVLRLPAKPLHSAVTVVELDFDGEPVVYGTPKLVFDSATFVDSATVRIAEAPEMEFRYTMDGSEPGLASKLYQAPLRIEEPTVLKVVGVHRGRVATSVVSQKFERATPLPTISPTNPLPGLRLETYRASLSKLEGATLQNPTVSVADAVAFMEAGESEVRVYQGFVQVPATQVYIWRLTSDDGSRLVLDDKWIIDNDGLHSSTTVDGEVALEKGWHKIRLEWFNQTGGAALDLQWRVPGGEWKGLAAGDLAHEAGTSPEA